LSDVFAFSAVFEFSEESDDFENSDLSENSECRLFIHQSFVFILSDKSFKFCSDNSKGHSDSSSNSAQISFFLFS